MEVTGSISKMHMNDNKYIDECMYLVIQQCCNQVDLVGNTDNQMYKLYSPPYISTIF